MKKILTNFSGNILSRGQMRSIKGGLEEEGACPGTYYSTKQKCELECPTRCLCSGTAPNSDQHVCG